MALRRIFLIPFSFLGSLIPVWTLFTANFISAEAIGAVVYLQEKNKGFLIQKEGKVEGRIRFLSLKRMYVLYGADGRPIATARSHYRKNLKKKYPLLTVRDSHGVTELHFFRKDGYLALRQKEKNKFLDYAETRGSRFVTLSLPWQSKVRLERAFAGWSAEGDRWRLELSDASSEASVETPLLLLAAWVSREDRLKKEHKTLKFLGKKMYRGLQFVLGSSFGFKRTLEDRHSRYTPKVGDDLIQEDEIEPDVISPSSSLGQINQDPASAANQPQVLL